MNLMSRWRVGTVLLLVPLAVAAVILTLLAGIEHGGLLWAAFPLAAIGALVLLGSAARDRYAWAGLGALAVAAVMSGWTVWSTPTFDEHTRATQLLGAGAPSQLTTVSWLLTILVVLLGAATVVWRTDFAAIPGQLWCVLLAAAVLVAGVAATGVWLGGRGLVALRTDSIAGSTVDHTVDASADAERRSRADTVTGPAGWRKLWEHPIEGRTVVGTPAGPLLVAADDNAGDQSGITVYDNHTGAERWHWRTRLFSHGSVALSPFGEIMVIAGSSAILLDLDSGVERKRFALPAPTLQPTLNPVTYRATGTNSGQLVTVDTATGTESTPSDTLPCREPFDFAIASDVLVVSCGSNVMAFG